MGPLIRVGLDVGGVIIDSVANDGTDTDLRGPNFLEASAVPDSFDGVARLVMVLGKENVFIISKCGFEMQMRTRNWLSYKAFEKRTGFDYKNNLYFCRQRAEKAPIARELGLTHFVDDRLDVLGYMAGAVPNRLLFGPQPEFQQTPGDVRNVRHLMTWREVVREITHAPVG